MRARHVTEKGLTEKFREFLKKEGALEKYLYNFNHDAFRFVLSYELRKNSYFLIVRAFVWQETPEGVGYWRRLDDMWRKICDE